MTAVGVDGGSDLGADFLVEELQLIGRETAQIARRHVPDRELGPQYPLAIAGRWQMLPPL